MASVVRIISGGDEVALEDKINQYLAANVGENLQSLQVQQVQYIGRSGQAELGFMAVLVLRTGS